VEEIVFEFDLGKGTTVHTSRIWRWR